jgi:hypothetical protein
MGYLVPAFIPHGEILKGILYQASPTDLFNKAI